MHRDDALISFNIPLSADFEYQGGGTRFEGSGAVFRQPLGQAVCHASGMRHAGNAISRGVRWVLVVFLVSTEVPQLSRRCASIAAGSVELASVAAAAGEEKRAAEARERARKALLTALSLAPTDFQLHHDLGLFHMDVGDAMRARRAFQRAISLYPCCPRPHTALALLLCESGRYRAAFRHYEAARTALERQGGGHDRNLGLQIASGGARCLLVLCEHQQGRRGASEAAMAFPAARMKEVSGWLRGALATMGDCENEGTQEARQLLRELVARCG